MRPINLQEIEQKTIKNIRRSKAIPNKEIFENAYNFLKDYNISLPNRKYIQKASLLIEDMWTDIRKGKLHSESPLIPIKPRRMETAILRPIYNHNQELLLEIIDGRRIERIFMDREKFKYFRYEKSIITDYGSATLKYVDSRTANNKDVANHVNETLTSYFEKMFPKVPRNKYFYKYFTRDEL